MNFLNNDFLSISKIAKDTPAGAYGDTGGRGRQKRKRNRMKLVPQEEEEEKEDPKRPKEEAAKEPRSVQPPISKKKICGFILQAGPNKGSPCQRMYCSNHRFLNDSL